MIDFDTLNRICESMSDDTIKCPHCGYAQTITPEDHDDLFTYHGDGDPVVINCMDCDGEITVKEIVRRTFYVVGEDE